MKLMVDVVHTIFIGGPALTTVEFLSLLLLISLIVYPGYRGCPRDDVVVEEADQASANGQLLPEAGARLLEGW